jgi:hypothetical protein
MSDEAVLAAEDAFFTALLAADRAGLDTVLAPDFALVDVLAGQVVPRAVLLDLVGSAELVFVDIARDSAQASVRHRAGVAVVVGRTRMTMRAQGDELTVHSRYTHVYVADQQQWRLLAAQGTQETSTDPAPV